MEMLISAAPFAPARAGAVGPPGQAIVSETRN